MNFELLRASCANGDAGHSSLPPALQVSALVGVKSHVVLLISKHASMLHHQGKFLTRSGDLDLHHSRTCWSFENRKHIFFKLLFSSRNMSKVRILVYIIFTVGSEDKHALNIVMIFIFF